MAKELTQDRVMELIAGNNIDTLIEESCYLDKIVAAKAMEKMNVYSLRKADYEDLLGTIRLSFVVSATTYDPSKGIDWIKYIVKMGKFSGMRFISKHINYSNKTVSNVRNTDGDIEDILDIISYDPEEVLPDIVDLLYLAEKSLTESEYTIINALYLERKNVKDVADELNHSTDYISINRNRALKKLKTII